MFSNPRSKKLLSSSCCKAGGHEGIARLVSGWIGIFEGLWIFKDRRE